VLLLIHNEHVKTSDAETGEILIEHRMDVTKDYQKPIWRDLSPSEPVRRRGNDKSRRIILLRLLSSML